MALRVVDRMRGSRWQSALSTGSKWSRALPGGGLGEREATAEPPPASPSRQRRQEFSGEFRKTGEISRFNLWRLISCAVRRQQVAVGTADCPVYAFAPELLASE